MNIAVGMSGGVDSSVAAHLLKKEGHHVTGVTMRIWRGDEPARGKGNACYGPGEGAEIRRAAEVCGRLRIPHHVFDLSREYEHTVLSYFKNEYLSGRTPNPCVVCNCRMKFGLLFESAIGLTGAEYFATGHYARVDASSGNGRSLLRKARDESKDQSYFLYRLGQEQLERTVFPLGNLLKEDVRSIAEECDIPSWDEPESQDFYNGDYGDLVREEDDPGEIVDTAGNVLGTHRGIWNFTVGQRKGLGLSHPMPLYVIAIDADRKRVVVAPKEQTFRRVFLATRFNWVSVEELTTPGKGAVKTRSAHPGAPCTAETVDEDTVRIFLDQPESGIAAGQSAVLYDGDIVLGGGIIQPE